MGEDNVYVRCLETLEGALETLDDVLLRQAPLLLLAFEQ